MSDPDLPEVERKYLPFWQEKSRALCVKDDPPMRGFGKSFKMGDEVVVEGVIFDSIYRLSIPSECAFYEMIGYWEVML